MLISLLGFAVLWQVISYFAPPYMVPGWERILPNFVALRWDFVLITALRVIGALVISFLLGAVGTAILYSSSPIERYVLPLVKLLTAVPVVCWVVFSVLWIKGLEFRIAFVLIVVCGPVFLVDILDAMKGVPKELRDMLWSYRPTRWEFFSKLMIPATIPAMLTSWKVNVSLAVRVVTMAELVGATTGIGYGLVIAQELFSVAEVFAWTLVLVVMLFIGDLLLERVERRVLRWRT